MPMLRGLARRSARAEPSSGRFGPFRVIVVVTGLPRRTRGVRGGLRVLPDRVMMPPLDAERRSNDDIRI
jgi:hypothetical protein